MIDTLSQLLNQPGVRKALDSPMVRAPFARIHFQRK